MLSICCSYNIFIPLESVQHGNAEGYHPSSQNQNMQGSHSRKQQGFLDVDQHEKTPPQAIASRSNTVPIEVKRRILIKYDMFDFMINSLLQEMDYVQAIHAEK